MAESLLDQLKTDGGTSIDLGDLTALVAGILAQSLSSGYASWIDAILTTFVIRPISGLGAWLGELVDALLGIPIAITSGSWWATERFVGGFGLVAFPIGVVLIVVLAYIVSTGWDLSG